MPDLQPTVEDEEEDDNWGAAPPSQPPQSQFAGAPQSAPERYSNLLLYEC